jgi:hypothetical protein
VVRRYEAWGKTAQAAAWKEKLGLADLPGVVFALPWMRRPPVVARPLE